MTENEIVRIEDKSLDNAISAYKTTIKVFEKSKDSDYCTTLDKVTVALLEELKQYRAIGTVEEFKALKERDEPKEIWGNEYNPVYIGDTVNGLCPICNTKFACITPRFYKANNYGYCKECGQKLDWQ